MVKEILDKNLNRKIVMESASGNSLESSNLRIVEVPNEDEGLTLLEIVKKNKIKESSEEYIRLSKEKKEKLKVLENKYKKGDAFDFYLEKKGNLYHIILEGVNVGVFSIRDKGNIKQISIINLAEELRNKGLGRDVYIKLNKYFNQLDGSVLASDEVKTSEDADRLWESLVRDGLAEKTGNIYILGKNEIRFKK